MDGLKKWLVKELQEGHLLDRENSISMIKKFLINTLDSLGLLKKVLWIKYTKGIFTQREEGGPSSKLYKQEKVRDFAKNTSISILVETGTYLGDMIAANLEHFNKLYSIELDEKLYLKATKRFQDQKKVQLLRGNSSKMIGQILKKLDKPAIFWLDAHYSGGITAKSENPILDELSQICKNWQTGSVVLIDDARLFTRGEKPSLEDIERLIKGHNRQLSIKIEDDIIIIK